MVTSLLPFLSFLSFPSLPYNLAVTLIVATVSITAPVVPPQPPSRRTTTTTVHRPESVSITLSSPPSQSRLFEEVMAYIETPLKTIIEEGDGLEDPECGDLVEVNCTGLLLDGTPVWSSRKPLKFTLSKGPPEVKKWHAGLKTMKKGEKARFTIPFVLSDLPEEETPIHVDVEMLSWEKVRGKKKKPNAKRNKRNANAAPWHGKRVQAEGLPPGWLMGRKKTHPRKGLQQVLYTTRNRQSVQIKKGG